MNHRHRCASWGTLSALVASAAVAACGITPVQPPRLAKPGVTDRQQVEDRKDCIEDAKISVTGPIAGAPLSGGGSNFALSQKAFLKCMRDRGYVLDPQGPYDGRPGLGLMPLVP